MCKASPETATALCVRCLPVSKLSFSPFHLFSCLPIPNYPKFYSRIYFRENKFLRKSGMFAGIFYVNKRPSSATEVKNWYLKHGILSLHCLN